MAEYAPGYIPRDQDGFDRMLTVFRGCENQDELRSWVVTYTLDMSYFRQDIIVALGRVEREKGWRS